MKKSTSMRREDSSTINHYRAKHFVLDDTNAVPRVDSTAI